MITGAATSGYENREWLMTAGVLLWRSARPETILRPRGHFGLLSAHLQMLDCCCCWWKDAGSAGFWEFFFFPDGINKHGISSDFFRWDQTKIIALLVIFLYFLFILVCQCLNIHCVKFVLINDFYPCKSETNCPLVRWLSVYSPYLGFSDTANSSHRYKSMHGEGSCTAIFEESRLTVPVP